MVLQNERLIESNNIDLNKFICLIDGNMCKAMYVKEIIPCFTNMTYTYSY